MTTTAIMLLGAIGTYGIRSAVILAGDRFDIGELNGSSNRLISPAVLAAIVCSSLFVSGGAVSAPPPIELAALGGGLLAVRLTDNVGAALIVGLPIYWIGAMLGLG